MTPNDAAKALGISKKDLLKFVKEGKIKAESITKNTIRFKPEVIEKFAKQLKI